ncbi:MAG: glycosyltransferase [Verrucomicrobia bacterium]|nr:glycosyltransferase [Verrucomicrobiota bacterium]
MSTALVVVALVWLALLLLRAGLAMSYARRQPTDVAELRPGALTVAQAILSGDPLLEARLEANLRALRDQRFIWLIDDDDVEAQRLTRALAARHPEVEVRLESCPLCPDGLNPKVWKLRRASPLATTPYLAVLDDDTLLPAASAAALVAAADRHTVSTGLPQYEDGGDLPSALLAQFVNNSSIFTYLGTARLLAPFTLNGMGYVLRTEALGGLGHFEPIQRELTDDLALATLVRRRGGTIAQSTAPLLVRTAVRDLPHYAQLMHRWHVFALLLLRRQSAPVQLLIAGLHGLPPLLLLAMLGLAALQPGLFAACVVAGVCGLRALVLVAMQQRIFGGVRHRPILSFVSELLQPLHLLHAACSRTIRWRTRRYRVRDTDDFSAV